eukprot:GFUD01032789.1.p1 GENE.GFUD01032789.1~~GFUD01032789.1.p1  ORF type:complete len:189 (+),score=62.50 GFUD01032789.1:48-614(+)
MEVSSKMARQMAYKRKLEEEYRLAEERRNSWKRSNYSGYQVSLQEEEEWDYEEDKERELDVLKQKQKEEEEKKERIYQKEKEKLLKKRREYIARAAKFSELKKKRLDEKKMIDKSNQILEDQDFWAELEKILKENEIALQDLENYKRIIEIEEKEEKTDPVWCWRPRSAWGILGSCNKQISLGACTGV